MSLTLPPGRTESEAIARAVEFKRTLWANLKNEDERLVQLEAACIRACCGDVRSGKALAQIAIWSPGR